MEFGKKKEIEVNMILLRTELNERSSIIQDISALPHFQSISQPYITFFPVSKQRR